MSLKESLAAIRLESVSQQEERRQAYGVARKGFDKRFSEDKRFIRARPLLPRSGSESNLSFTCWDMRFSMTAFENDSKNSYRSIDVDFPWRRKRIRYTFSKEGFLLKRMIDLRLERSDRLGGFEPVEPEEAERLGVLLADPTSFENLERYKEKLIR